MAQPSGPYLQIGDFVTVDDNGCVTKAARTAHNMAVGVVMSTEYPEGCLIVWNEKAM